jgi:branched-chain amino acid transport system permease protein
VATFLATYDFLLVSMVLAAVLALTLYLPLMAGQLSIASPGFYALGGYIAAILSTKVFHPGPGLYPVRLVLLEMAVAAVASGIFGLAVGVPALRLRGIFLALATIAFVQILGVVALNLDVTGGTTCPSSWTCATASPCSISASSSRWARRGRCRRTLR